MEIEIKPKRLYRSRRERKVAGVCGGLADYFNVDPTWVRVIFILLCLLGLGTFLIVYVIFWLIVPLEPASTSTLTANKHE